MSSLSVIGAATLSRSSLVIPQNLSWHFLVEGFIFGSNLKDYWQNILLFIPWGFALAAISNSKIKHIWIILFISLFCSAFLSTSIEFIQLFLADRVSNLTDIICNSLGGCLGGILYLNRLHIINFIVLVVRGNFRRLSYRSIFLAIAIHCSIITLGILVLLFGVNLDNWDNGYHLAIGNEVTGDRPWNGKLRSLYISDRGLDTSEIAKVFQDSSSFFESDSNLVMALDFTSDRTSNLVWQHKSNKKTIVNNTQDLNHNNNSIINLNQKQWFKSKLPTVNLSNRIEKTAELTISLNIATNDLNQFGPARIISLSKNIYIQNLVIGQQKNDLYFRLRTSLSGRNASQPEFIVPNVFKSQNFQQILVTFKNKKLDFYIDKYQNHYSHSFDPDTSFIVFLPWNLPVWQINLKTFNPVKYQAVFYTIIIIPIIFLTSILAFKYFYQKSSKLLN